MATTINGATPASLGIASAVLTLRSGGVDVLVIETTESLTAAPRWAVGDEITVESGTVQFRGTVRPRMASGTGRAERRRYEVYSAAIDLRRVAFKQPWAEWPLASESAPETIAFKEWCAALIGIARNPAQPAVPAGLSEKGLGVSISDALGRAAAAGAAVAAGTLSADLVMPPQRVSNLMCSAIIDECARRLIDAGKWWDYGANPAQFHCVKYSDLASVTLSPGTHGVSRLEIGEIWQEKIPGVRIRLMRQTPRTVVGDGVYTVGNFTDPFQKVTTDFIDVTAGDVGSELGILEAAVQYTDDFTATEAQAAADYLYAAATNSSYRGSVTVVGAEPAWTLRPGKRLNLAGLQTEWATMEALTQQVTHDLMSGTTTVTFGPGDHLGFADLREWLRWFGSRTPSRDDIAQRDAADSSGETYGFGKGADSKTPPISSITTEAIGADGVVVIAEVTDDGHGNYVIRQRKLVGGDHVTQEIIPIDGAIKTEGEPGVQSITTEDIGTGNAVILSVYDSDGHGNYVIQQQLQEQAVMSITTEDLGAAGDVVITEVTEPDGDGNVVIKQRKLVAGDHVTQTVLEDESLETSADAAIASITTEEIGTGEQVITSVTDDGEGNFVIHQRKINGVGYVTMSLAAGGEIEAGLNVDEISGVTLCGSDDERTLLAAPL